MKGKETLVIFLSSIIIIAGISIGIIIQNRNNDVDVRIGFLEGDLHQLAFYVARENNYYQEENLTISAVAFSNGADVMAAFEALPGSPQIDIAYLGIAPAVYHRFNNPAANIKILASVNVNGSSLIVRDNDLINNSSDLIGKKIAVPALHNMQDFILTMILDEAGLTHDNITLKEMAVSDMRLSLQNGDIDGYVAWEPHNVKGTTNGYSGKYLYNSSQVWNNHPCCVIAGNEDFIESQSDITQTIIDIHVKATNWILNNWEQAKIIAMNKMYLSDVEATNAMANIGYVYENNLENMQIFVDKLVNLNPYVSFSSENIGAGITTSSEFIEYFVDGSFL